MLLAEVEQVLGALAASGGNDSARAMIRAFSEANEAYDDEALATSAAELYRLRRRRERHLDADLLGEPGWDILLDLFVNTVRCNPVRVTAACVAGGVPATTALRWIASLEQRGLLKRAPDPFDRRVALLRLTNEGLDRMRAALTEVCNRGFYPREPIGMKALSRTSAPI